MTLSEVGSGVGRRRGAVLGAAIDGVGAGLGALVGVLVYAPASSQPQQSCFSSPHCCFWRRR